MTAIHKCCDGLPDAESYKMGWGRVACVNGFTVRDDYKTCNCDDNCDGNPTII